MRYFPFTVEQLQTPEGVSRLNDLLEQLSNMRTLLDTAYSVSNLTTDRTYDADSTSVAEVADVLGTLISDLERLNILPS